MSLAAALIALLLFDSPEVLPNDPHDHVVVDDRNEPGAPSEPHAHGGDGSPGQAVEVRYDPLCSPGQGTDTTCSETYTCDPGQTRYNVWRRVPGGVWEFSGTVCRGGPPSGVGSEAPVVTPGDVLREVRRLPLPKARLSIQPGGRTLVNLDTVFSTSPPALDRTVSILGQRVHITAKPTGYRWQFGDGASTTSQGPGRPYPAMDVTHRYTKADRTVHPRVDVTFTISFAVGGGPTQTLEQTVTTDGVAATLTVREAVPVLVG